MVIMRTFYLAVLFVVTALSLFVLAERTLLYNEQAKFNNNDEKAINPESQLTTTTTGLSNCSSDEDREDNQSFKIQPNLDQVNRDNNLSAIQVESLRKVNLRSTSDDGQLETTTSKLVLEDNWTELDEENVRHDQVDAKRLVEMDDDEKQGQSGGDAIIIDRIKGVDLEIIKKDADESLLRRANESEKLLVSSRLCSETKYDRLVAQGLRSRSLSKAIVKTDGRFDNPFPTWRQPSAIDAVQFALTDKDETGLPASDAVLEKMLPILRPNFEVKDSEKNGFRVTWIGHSTLLIQVDGLNILTDPIFSERAGPTRFIGYMRYREPACDIKSLPPIDIVLISHNHYDHLDYDSVESLNGRFGKACRWIVPLGLGDYMQSMGVKNYVELDWWQKDCITVDRELDIDQPDLERQRWSNSRALGRQAGAKMNLDIFLTPAQHWSRRGVNDDNKSLWGSFTLISSRGLRFFFAGDTGYCKVFKEIGKIFGPFTGAAIPIGAYKPRWFLRPQHVDPYEAVDIHKDIGSQKSLAIHHATFALAHEFYLEPAKLLRGIMNNTSGVASKDSFIAVKHGETLNFCKNC